MEAEEGEAKGEEKKVVSPPEEAVADQKKIEDLVSSDKKKVFFGSCFFFCEKKSFFSSKKKICLKQKSSKLNFDLYFDLCQRDEIIQVGLNKHLYDNFGDASSSLRGSTSSLNVELVPKLHTHNKKNSTTLCFFRVLPSRRTRGGWRGCPWSWAARRPSTCTCSTSSATTTATSSSSGTPRTACGPPSATPPLSSPTASCTAAPPQTSSSGERLNPLTPRRTLVSPVTEISILL